MSESKPKKRFFLNHKKSSAFMVSMAIHVAFLMIALTFVAVKVYVKPEQTFEVKDVKRPRMNLRKLQVPVKEHKKTQAPKLRHTIVTKPKNPDINIKMPEIVGVPGGSGFGRGQGLGGLGFNFDMDLFGSSRGTGNEFIGTFYDLKQTPDGELTEIGDLAQKNNKPAANAAIYKVIKGFVGSGFNEARLKDYFTAPKLKYATVLMMPSISADAAPKAFGVDDQVKPSYWLCHYKGQIAAPETGRYRFCGLGDDVLLVRVGRRLVLDACWPEHIKQMSNWMSKDENNRKFPLDTEGMSGIDYNDIYSQLEDAGALDGSSPFYSALRGVRINGEPISGGYFPAASRMVIGDWIDLKKGQAMDVDILIGEIPGGKFMCRLMIEQFGKDEDKQAQSDAGRRKILPAFKTTAIDEKLISQMKIYPDQTTLEGPAFGVGINAPQKPAGPTF